MKRIITLSLAIIFAFSLCFSASADNNNTVVIDNYTIVFDENCTLTQAEKQHLAQLRVNHAHADDNHASTYGVVCSLLGHKTTTELIIVTEHCVSPTPPRCVETYENLTVCSRCDYVEIDVLSSTYMYCCD